MIERATKEEIFHTKISKAIVNDSIGIASTETNCYIIRRLGWLIWVLAANLFCLACTITNYVFSDWVYMSLGILYLLWVLGLFNELSERGVGKGFFMELRESINNNNLYSRSKEIPKNPPLKGECYLYIRKHSEDSWLSKPHRAQLQLTNMGKDIDFNTIYSAHFIMGEFEKRSGHFYGNSEYANFKRQVLKEIEGNGLIVECIMDRFGNPLWEKSEREYSLTKLRITLSYVKLYTFIVILNIGIITPLIWIVKLFIRE